MRNITFLIISIIAVAVILQQCFMGDCQKVGVKKNQYLDHKHDPVNCNHPSHKHEHDHDHVGHSGHDHTGHNHDYHKAGSVGNTRTRPRLSNPLESKVPRSLFPPIPFGYKVDNKLPATNYSEYLQ